MSIIYVLIPIAMLFVIIAVSIFFWAVKSEQFDDLDRQSVSILFDEDDANVNNAAVDANPNSEKPNDPSLQSAKATVQSTNTFPATDNPNTKSAPINMNDDPLVSSSSHTKPE